MGTGLQPVLGGAQAPAPPNISPGVPPMGSGQHPAMAPPGPPPGMHPGAMHGMPPGRPPGMPPGMQPGMPGQVPHGMPGHPPAGMPEPAPGGHSPGMPSQGVISARRRRKKGKGGGGGKQPLNIQLVRNVVVGLAAVMVLLMITSFIINRGPTTTNGGGTPQPTIQPGTPTPPGPAADADRKDRTDEEIIRDAESAFQTATTYLRQHRIADENLSVAIENFQQARSELSLVDASRWPAWTADIDPQLDEAERKLDQKFKDAKLAYVRAYQSADYDVALQELERIIRLIPDKKDSRNDYARTRIRTIREIMSGGKKKGRWDKHKM